MHKNLSTGGFTSEEERNHVIKVLEHESKVYRFEKNLINMLNGGDFDVHSEQGRVPGKQQYGYEI